MLYRKKEDPRRTAKVVSFERGNALARVHTAVAVSMHNTKGSEVRYLESERAYSFHNWPKNSCEDAMRVWFKEK